VPFFGPFGRFGSFSDAPTEEMQWRQRVSAAKKAWFWIHAAIMQEEGEMIGKLGERILKNVFSGLGWSVAGRGLDR